MFEYRTIRPETNPVDPQSPEGALLPSLIGSRGDVSIGIHPLPGGIVEIRAASPEGEVTEEYPGGYTMGFAHAIRRGWVLARVLDPAWGDAHDWDEAAEA